MASKEEIAACFQELNINASDAVLNKCLEMCLTYNIVAEDFCDQWYAYTASNLNGALPTIEHLDKMERKEFQKNKDQVFSRQSLLTPKHNPHKITGDLDDAVVSSYLELTPKSNRNISHTSVQNKQTPKTPVAKNLSDSYVNSPAITSEKYSQRSDSRSVQCYYGSQSAKYKRESDLTLSVKNQNEHSLTSDVKYMYEVMGKKSKCLDNITYNLGHAILETHGLSLSEGLLRTQLGEMTTYGRIVSDSDGKINVQSVLLEGSQETNLCNTTTLNINKLQKYSLFPGQVVAIQGNNVNSSTFIAEKIFTGATLNLPEEFPLKTDQMQIVIAAGPFTLQDNLSYQPLHDLLHYVSEYQPHILILMGPFLERTHDSIHDGGLTQTFDSFFEGLVENIMGTVQPIDTHVIIISSQKDAHHHPVYPTPPFKIAERYNNLTFVPDPCMININGLVIGATSADVLLHISNFELYFDKNPSGPIDRMGRMASHILNQHSFYPLYPPFKGMCIDHELLEQFGTLECKPHVLILPSNLKNFIKNIQDCLVINPERLTKGYVAGTYARLEINPGNTNSICDRTSCQILRI
ncbi:DNA polymerase alpha subunit B [Leptinotarsa decemlineata]|uniref:DNA polymerase alpha subunit B n=1 Tax=Leptinotarsa decemlineata TaxID=7539 RepID=UPI003D3094BA